MTVSGDFMPSADEDLGATPTYPTLFGIALSPTVLGVLFAVLGIGVTAYCGFYVLQPTWTKNQELNSTLQNKTNEVSTLNSDLKKSGEMKAALVTAQQRQKDVLSLFSSEQTLDTLLLDINRLVKARNLTLNRFTPEQGITVITDGSFGPAVNNKLARKNITMEVEGSFEQTQSFLRGIERLQPLLLVKTFNTNLDRSEQKVLIDAEGKLIPVGKPTTKLKTSFVLQALLPAPPPPPGTPAAPPAK